MSEFLDLLTDPKVSQAIEKFASKLAQFYEEDKPVYLFSVKVDSIELQRDDIDLSRLKRGKAQIAITEKSGKSKLIALVEFRGRTLILSRKEGSCKVGEVGRRLSSEFSKKYPKENLKPDRVLDGGRVHHYTVQNPQNFLDFLHLMQRVPAFEIYTQQGEHVMQKLIEWAKERQKQRRAA